MPGRPDQLDDSVVYLNRMESPYGPPAHQRYRDSEMPHSYRGRTPSPTTQHRRIIPPQSRDYPRALLDDEDDEMYEQSRSEILDRNRKSYSLPMRQSLAVYDDTDVMDYEIPPDYVNEQDPYGVKKEKVRQRTKDDEQADKYYDRVVNPRPKRPGLSPRRHHYDYYYYIDEDDNNNNNNKSALYNQQQPQQKPPRHRYHDNRYHNQQQHDPQEYRSSSRASGRRSAVDDAAADDYYLKSYFRNFRPPMRRYDTEQEYGRYDDQQQRHHHYGNDRREYQQQAPPRRNYGNNDNGRSSRTGSYKQQAPPTSGRTSRGEFSYYDNAPYDDRTEYDSIKRRNYQYPKRITPPPPRPLSRSRNYDHDQYDPPPRQGSRASHYEDQHKYDPLPPRHGSRASNYDPPPPRHSSSRASNYEAPPRYQSRASNYDLPPLPTESRNSYLPRQDSFQRQSSRSYKKGIPEEDIDLYTNEDERDESRQQDQEFEYQDKSYTPDDLDATEYDKEYRKEHELMRLLREGRSIDQILPDPGLKSVYVYKTRGPDKLEIFDRPDDVIDYNPEDFYRAPTCDIKLRSHTVWEKMYVKFTCTVKGKPLPKVIWYKNMIPIQPMISDAGHIKITSQYGVHTLEIYRACLDDSGTYRVSAQNCKGEISSFASLVVKRYQPGKMGFISNNYHLTKDIGDKVVFTTKLWNKYAIEGQSINLSCQVDGKQPLDVVWSFNGKELKLDDRKESTSEGKTFNLLIKNATPDDEGEYGCQVWDKSNNFATSRCHLYVNGNGTSPSAPTGIRIDDVTSDYVTVSWDPPGYGGNLGEGDKAVGYILEGSEKNSRVWTKLNRIPVSLTTTSLNVDEETTRFRVMAVNQGGCSLPSVPVEITKIRKKSENVQKLEMKSLNVNFDKETSCFFLSWHPTVVKERNFSNLRIQYCNMDRQIGEIPEESWVDTNLKIPTTCWSYPVEGLTLSDTSNLKFRILGCVDDEKEEQKLEFITSASVNNSSVEENEDSKVLSLSSPSTINCLNTSRDHIEIGWLPPMSSDGKVAFDHLSYMIEYRKVDEDSIWHSANVKPIKFTRFPVGSLETGKRYEFRVRAVNQSQTSKFSEISQPYLATDCHETPTWQGNSDNQFCVAIGKNGRPVISKTSVKLCWEAPTYNGGSDVKGYQLEYKLTNSKSEDSWRQLNNKPIKRRYFTCENLDENQFYDFRMRACNTSGWSEWIYMKVSVCTREVSYSPQNVRAKNLDENSIEVKWNSPKPTNNNTIIRYLIERKLEGSDQWIACNGEPETMTPLKYVIRGLNKGETFSFRVKSVVGESREEFISETSSLIKVGRKLNPVEDYHKKSKEEKLPSVQEHQQSDNLQKIINEIEVELFEEVENENRESLQKNSEEFERNVQKEPKEMAANLISGNQDDQTCKVKQTSQENKTQQQFAEDKQKVVEEKSDKKEKQANVQKNTSRKAKKQTKETKNEHLTDKKVINLEQKQLDENVTNSNSGNQDDQICKVKQTSQENQTQQQFAEEKQKVVEETSDKNEQEKQANVEKNISKKVKKQIEETKNEHLNIQKSQENQTQQQFAEEKQKVVEEKSDKNEQEKQANVEKSTSKKVKKQIEETKNEHLTDKKVIHHEEKELDKSVTNSSSGNQEDQICTVKKISQENQTQQQFVEEKQKVVEETSDKNEQEKQANVEKNTSEKVKKQTKESKNENLTDQKEFPENKKKNEGKQLSKLDNETEKQAKCKDETELSQENLSKRQNDLEKIEKQELDIFELEQKEVSDDVDQERSENCESVRTVEKCAEDEAEMNVSREELHETNVKKLDNQETNLKEYDIEMTDEKQLKQEESTTEANQENDETCEKQHLNIEIKTLPENDMNEPKQDDTIKSEETDDETINRGDNEKEEEKIAGAFLGRLEDYKKTNDENEIITFRCEVNHHSVEVTWFYNNEKVCESSSKFEIAKEGCERRLTIKSCDETDQQQQQVTCVTADNSDVTSARILFDANKEVAPVPDYLINFEQALETEVTSEYVRLYCVLTSLKHDTSIIWYRDDQVLHLDDDNQTSYKSLTDFRDAVVSLQISPVDYDALKGKFTCEFISPQNTFDAKLNFEFTTKVIDDVLAKYQKLKEGEVAYPRKTVKFAEENQSGMKVYLEEIHGTLEVVDEED